MEMREKILKTAGSLFIKDGVRLITMDIIAQHLGISKRTIYENFKDKNDLLYNFLTDELSKHKREIINIMQKSDNVIDALFSFGEYNQQKLQKINPVFFNDMKKYHAQIFHTVIQNENFRNYEVTYTILKRGLNEGTFRKEIDIDIANRFIHHLMDFFHKLEDEKEFIEKCDHQKIWKSVHLPYLRGLCTDKGQDLIEKFMQKYENLENN
ncbi:MAG TPA: TetR/AcrR family transcriptional regulator [Prolixibacteraceae bacterium]|nr:TetR/AcrR family transcriptional regulator [Prolixibacteraceae bacterium]